MATQVEIARRALCVALGEDPERTTFIAVAVELVERGLDDRPVTATLVARDNGLADIFFTVLG